MLQRLFGSNVQVDNSKSNTAIGSNVPVDNSKSNTEINKILWKVVTYHCMQISVYFVGYIDVLI